jgi:hypothetical protein
VPAKTKKVTINVTMMDIAKGKKMRGGWCPVALAMRRKGFKRVCVNGYTWKKRHDGKNYPMPESVAIFASLFDRGEEVSPFKFTLEVPLG